MGPEIPFGSRRQKYLTVAFAEKGVKRVVAVILDFRLVLVVKPGEKLKPSIQQSLGFSTIDDCRKTTPR